jgi:hypothetical protein
MLLKYPAKVISCLLGVYSDYETGANEADRAALVSLVQNPRMSNLFMETVDYMPKDLRQIYRQTLAKKAEELAGTAL